MTIRGYDAWKLATPPEYEYDERCIRDDSTECDCARCAANEDRFWDEQEGDDSPDDEECPFCDYACSACSPMVAELSKEK